MTSAPRSARTCVPKGPAPNWETARMRTPSSGGRVMSVREPAFAEGGVILPGHEDLSRIGAHLLAPLIVRGGLDGHDAPVALSRLPQLEHAAPRIQGVAEAGGLLVLERVHLEIGDGPPRDIGHRHADDHAVHERPQ